jgi:hypothetical protein
MTFRDRANAAAAAILQRLGEGSATYQHANGDTVILGVMFEEGVEVPDKSGQYLERTRVVSMQKSALLATVTAGDEVTVLGDSYVVQRVISDDGVVVRVAVA